MQTSFAQRCEGGDSAATVRHDECIAHLLHLNGLPGAGKSLLADALAERLPLALVVDIDAIRTKLGQWKARPESKLLARDLAIALIDTHLGSGHDVVVPQFLGRVDFIERLEQAASTGGADFIEVLLVVEPEAAVQRPQVLRVDASDGLDHTCSTLLRILRGAEV